MSTSWPARLLYLYRSSFLPFLRLAGHERFANVSRHHRNTRLAIGKSANDLLCAALTECLRYWFLSFLFRLFLVSPVFLFFSCFIAARRRSTSSSSWLAGVWRLTASSLRTSPQRYVNSHITHRKIAHKSHNLRHCTVVMTPKTQLACATHRTLQFCAVGCVSFGTTPLVLHRVSFTRLSCVAPTESNPEARRPCVTCLQSETYVRFLTLMASILSSLEFTRSLRTKHTHRL